MRNGHVIFWLKLWQDIITETLVMVSQNNINLPHTYIWEKIHHDLWSYNVRMLVAGGSQGLVDNKYVILAPVILMELSLSLKHLLIMFGLEVSHSRRLTLIKFGLELDV